MKILLFKSHLLKRHNTYASLFSSAFREGIRDTYKEMGYSFDENSKRKKENDKPRSDSSKMIRSGNSQKINEENLLQDIGENKFS